jgi:hypothetical protein
VTLTAYVNAIGVRGPGLADWADAAAVLRREKDYVAAPTTLPPPEELAPTERRRTGRVARLALSVGFEATRRISADPANLPVVFASSGGDGDNCDAICRTLASPNRALSPTRFHNSVHNAPAGYWSIAAAAQVPTTTLCAYDASFSAGLIEALAQLATSGRDTALIAYDLDYPPPLKFVRPTPAPFAVALILSAAANDSSLARIGVRLDRGAGDACSIPALEELAAAIPAARALALLEVIALGRPATLKIGYLDPAVLRVEVSPCR